jgi:hypothetical protein
MKQHEENVTDAISQLTITQIEKMLTDASGLTMDSISRRICLIRREKVDEVDSGVTVSPITPSIQSRLAARFRGFARADQIRLYRFFLCVPGTRQSAGFLFEAIAQQILQGGHALQLIPMVHLAEKKKKSKSLPRWHSSHIALQNTSLETLRRNALRQKLSINVQPSHTVEYPRTGPSSISSNVFYVPEIDNEAALDSFILLGKHLYIFQFTIAANRDIKPRLMDFFEECRGVPPCEAWRFVFVIPPNQVLICPQPRNPEMRKLRLYTTAIDLSISGGTTVQ